MRTPSVSVQILGRAVDDNVRAEFDRCTGGRGEGEGEGGGEGDGGGEGNGGGGGLSCMHSARPSRRVRRNASTWNP